MSILSASLQKIILVSCFLLATLATPICSWAQTYSKQFSIQDNQNEIVVYNAPPEINSFKVMIVNYTGQIVLDIVGPGNEQFCHTSYINTETDGQSFGWSSPEGQTPSGEWQIILTSQTSNNTGKPQAGTVTIVPKYRTQ